MNIREIGSELDVGNLIEGSIQKIGNAVKINVQLIRADERKVAPFNTGWGRLQAVGANALAGFFPLGANAYALSGRY